MKYRISHVRALLGSEEFWSEYCFYVCYAALIWFVVQVMILGVEMHDYMIVVSMQLFSLMASALIFVSLDNHFQPSNNATKMLYFMMTNAPWLGMIYYRQDGMMGDDMIIYLTLSMISTVIGGWLYDRMFDRCCDYGYRLKTLYMKYKETLHNHITRKQSSWK